MPNTREKLIELIRMPIKMMPSKEFSPSITFTLPYAEEHADHLIANGVTFAEDNNVPSKWIPVTERLPEYEEPVMGWDAEMRDMGIVNFIYGQFFDILDMSETNVTHWMPLPDPPKGE